MNDVEVPETWSQMAVDILAQKYFRKQGVPQKNTKGEIKKDKTANQFWVEKHPSNKLPAD